LDLRLSKKFKTFKTQNIELSIDAFNFANILNKKWGANHSLGTQAIYVVKSFDAAEKKFVYTVNTNAGVSSLSGSPYQIQVGLRYSF